jgi:membrane protease YdiL (CAAX protease family)
MNDDELNTSDQAGVESEEPRLTILQCFGLIVLLIVLQLLTSLLLTRVDLKIFGETEWPNLAITHLVSGLLTAKAGAILAGISLLAFFQPSRVSASNLVLVIIGVVGISILSSELSNVLQSIQPISESYQDLFNRLSQQNVIGVVLAIGIIAPFTEELLFRGVILDGLRSNYPVKTAFFASTGLFAAVHVLPWLVLNAFLIGCFLAWLRIRTGSLTLCVLAHAIYNSLPFLLLRGVSIDIPGYTTGPARTIQFQPLWFDLLGAVLLAAGIAGINILNKQTSPVSADSAGDVSHTS